MWKWLLPTLTGVGGAGIGFIAGTQYPTEKAAIKKLSRVEEARQLLAKKRGGAAGD
jgi:hypothetical protein